MDSEECVARHGCGEEEGGGGGVGVIEERVVT